MVDSIRVGAMPPSRAWDDRGSEMVKKTLEPRRPSLRPFFIFPFVFYQWYLFKLENLREARAIATKN